MATLIVPPAPNGTKPRPAAPSRVIPLPSLAASVDHLAELRALIRRAQDEERKLTAQDQVLERLHQLDRDITGASEAA